MSQKRKLPIATPVTSLIAPSIVMDRLAALLQIPTAPFCEDYVSRYLQATLSKYEVPYFLDSIGNIIVGAHSLSTYQKTLRFLEKQRKKIPLFIAHMDHPGFHGKEWLKDHTSARLKVEWFGGAPTESLIGAKVRVFSKPSRVSQKFITPEFDSLGIDGIIESVQLTESKKTIQSAVLQMKPQNQLPPAKNLFGSFWFRGAYWKEEQLIYTKAADDLIGVYAILELAIQTQRLRISRQAGKTKRRKQTAESPFPFFALLSRAEEVGFIGTIGHFQQYFSKSMEKSNSKTKGRKRKEDGSPVLVVSLETSRQLPQAEIGKGPIVRLGDRASIFDSSFTQVLSELANLILPGKHQRRIMDGGSCEATAALAFGFPAIGISVPLGNYHNQSFEGGPESRGPNGPAPEFVHVADLQGMLQLIEGIVFHSSFVDAYRDPWKNKREELLKSFSAYKKYL